MINKNDVVEFFNKCAKDWDKEMIKDDTIVDLIIKNAGIGKGSSVLDVACGTGVLFNDYLSHGASLVTGVDISPEMIKIASNKFNDDRINIVCGDIEECSFKKPFDVVMVYNAFPHFQDPARLIYTLNTFLSAGGRLSIAHGMSKEKIDHHHSGSASAVSNHLITADQLKTLMDPYFNVDVVISDDHMYQVAGTKK